MGVIVEKVRALRPQVLHTHRLEMVPVLDRIAKKTGVPYTVRSHSVDTLNSDEKYSRLDGMLKWLKGQPNYRGFRPEHVVGYLNGPHCLGALALPYARARLETAGVAPEKIVDCFPVIAYDRFLDRGPNGNGVMNTGACIPKKRMEDFVDLGRLVPDRPFHLYAIGYESQVLKDYNKSNGFAILVSDVDFFGSKTSVTSYTPYLFAAASYLHPVAKDLKVGADVRYYYADRYIDEGMSFHVMLAWTFQAY